MRVIDANAFVEEMKRRKDAAWKWLIEAKDYETATRADAVLSFLYEVKLTLDKMPTVDAVPVVRCRDCKYWNPYKSHHYKGHFCDVVTLFVQENEYCAWGKRREDGADDAE